MQAVAHLLLLAAVAHYPNQAANLNRVAIDRSAARVLRCAWKRLERIEQSAAVGGRWFGYLHWVVV